MQQQIISYVLHSKSSQKHLINCFLFLFFRLVETTATCSTWLPATPRISASPTWTSFNSWKTFDWPNGVKSHLRLLPRIRVRVPALPTNLLRPTSTTTRPRKGPSPGSTTENRSTFLEPTR